MDKTINRCNDLTGKEWLQNSFSIWRELTKTQEEKNFKHPASYPVALCEKIIKTFTKEGANVLDPFNGIGSTTVAALNLNRNAVGIDLSKEFCTIAKKRIGKTNLIKIINGDSFEKIKQLKSNSFDLCLTSPPYWDILNMRRTVDIKENINYSNKNLDVGNISDYQEFLKSLSNLFLQVKRVLRPKGYCIINVMDLRKKSIFYPLHIDITNELQKNGLILDDIVIWDRQSDYNNMKPLGYPYKFRINKVHEYLLIFTKE